MNKINLSDYPFKANSSFAGKRYGNISIESVYRRARSNGPVQTSDYVAVLRSDMGTRAVVPYNKIVTAFRSSQPTSLIFQVFREATKEESYVDTTTKAVDPRGPGGTQASVAVQMTIGQHIDRISKMVDEDSALSFMIALVAVAKQNEKVKNIVKSMSSLL